MDMKRILQALDTASTKPVVGVDSMKKFVSIVNEGANRHQVSLPVQMAMNHYKPLNEIKNKAPSLLEKYFHNVEEEQVVAQEERRQILRQYSSKIAERVLMKESGEAGFKRTGMAGVGLQRNVAETPIELDTANPMSSMIHSHNKTNPASIEYRIMRARGQLRDLAKQAESNDPLVWQHISRLFPELQMNIEQVAHGLGELAKTRRKGGVRSKNIPAGLDEACWKDYKMVGTKKKGKKTVPNCVPK